MNRISLGFPRVHFPVFFSSLFSILARRRKLRLNHFIVGILSSFAFLVFSPLTARAAIIFSVDYEDRTFGNVSVRKDSPGAGYPSIAYQLPSTQSIQIVDTPVRSGHKAVRMQLTPTDEGYLYGKYKDPYNRVEFERSNLDYVGLTRWYGFSIYIDPSWTNSVYSGDGNGPAVVQFHQNPVGDACDQVHSPTLLILYNSDTNLWTIRNDSDPKACSTQTTRIRRTFTTPAIKGVWTDFVVNAKWSSGADGFLKVWKDGVLFVNVTGPNIYNNTNSKQNLKWGVYQAAWNNTTPPPKDTFIAYLDEIKIGDANSNYAEVAPKESESPPLSTPVNLRLIKNID